MRIKFRSANLGNSDNMIKTVIKQIGSPVMNQFKNIETVETEDSYE